MSFIESSLRRLAVALAVATVSAAVAFVAPAQAQAPRPNGYPVTNVNLRAGPGTYYPALLVVPSHAPIAILGCLGDYTWCDVFFQGNRGWMRSIYLQGWYSGYYYSLRDYAPRLGYRVVSFDLGPYWDANYRGRPFYADRGRWGGGTPYGEGATNRGAVLQPAGALRQLDLAARPICLGAAECRALLAALYGRPLGVHRPLRLDVGLQRAVRLGDLSLRPLGILQSRRLVLGAGQSLGAGLGVVAFVERLSRLGAAAAGL